MMADQRIKNIAYNEALAEEAKSFISRGWERKTERELTTVVYCKALDHSGYR